MQEAKYAIKKLNMQKKNLSTYVCKKGINAISIFYNENNNNNKTKVEKEKHEEKVATHFFSAQKCKSHERPF